MKHIIYVAMISILLGCGNKREINGLGDGLGWTSDEIANRIAVHFVLANGHSDWKVISVEWTSDGWVYTFITRDLDITVQDPLMTQLNTHIYSNKRSVFVRCDGGLVEMCPVG